MAEEKRYYNLPGGGKGDWLMVLKACCEVAKTPSKEFAGSWVADRAGWFPSLQTLRRYGILKKTGTARRGQRTYYKMHDIDGVKRALRKFLGSLDPLDFYKKGSKK